MEISPEATLLAARMANPRQNHFCIAPWATRTFVVFLHLQEI